MPDLSKMSDWDLVNSFVSSVWGCRMSVPKENRPNYDYYLKVMGGLRDELLKRLSNRT